jgi:DNA-binding transcriptional MerR regulator
MTATGGRMRIGEVHALLRQDYPDIELSKIRYYEDKGLVQPSRSRKGYRLYSERDVECLREAIRLAQEEFMPLRVVRVRLVEQGLLNDATASPATRQVAREHARVVVNAAVPTPDATPSRPTLTMVSDTVDEASDSPDDPEQLYSAQEFLIASGLDASAFNQLVGLGLVRPVNASGGSVFTGWDLRVARAAGPVLARGADARFLGSLRRIVERELGVVEDLTEPVRLPGNRLSAEQRNGVVTAVADEVEGLRRVLFERTVREYLES